METTPEFNRPKKPIWGPVSSGEMFDYVFGIADRETRARLDALASNEPEFRATLDVYRWMIAETCQ